MTDRPDSLRKRSGRGMQDSGVSSFGSESDTSPVQQTSSTSTVTGTLNTGPGQTGTAERPTATARTGSAGGMTSDQADDSLSLGYIYESAPAKGPDPGSDACRSTVPRDDDDYGAFHVTYYGELVLDKRYTRPMLPWIMAEIRRRSSRQELVLEIVPESHVLQGKTRDSGEILFQHRLPTVSSFARPHQDRTCFAYLTRSNVDNPFICHVFQVSEESQVRRLFTMIHEATKQAVRESHSQPPDGAVDQSVMSQCHLCEVMYVGKVVVTSNKAPPTFIDEAVEKFREHERRKLELGEDRQRHASGASVQSLPADIEGNIGVQATKARRTSELDVEVPRARRCSESCMNAGDEDEIDSIPLGGSSASLNSDIQVMSNSQDSINNMLTQHACHGSEGQRSESHEHDSLQKLVLQSHGQAKKNRTMLLQVGQNEVSLISTDKKKVIFERKFVDISFCSQGIQHPEHFGFISRDMMNNNMFMCYVFRCATEPLVDEVMQTLKQAFHAAHQQNAKNHVVCEFCPMHQLHKLCQEIDKQPGEKVHEILIRRVEQLSEKDRQDIMTEYGQSIGQSIQEKNEVLMSILRHMSELKQQQHVHISDSNKAKTEFILVDHSSEPNLHGNLSSKLDQLKSKAKKSLAVSFENILNRMAKKDDHRSDYILTSHMTDHMTKSQPTDCMHASFDSGDSSLGTTPDTTPLSSPFLKEFSVQFPAPSPEQKTPRVRSYSATVPPSHDQLQVTDSVHVQSQYGKLREDVMKKLGDASPLKSMFNKVTSSMTSSSCSRSPSPRRGASISPFSKGSWRMDILSRVVTPSKTPRNKGDKTRPKSGEEESQKHRWRHLWKRAILETLLLIRMEKENKSLKARQDQVDTRRIKLDYEEITPCLKEVTKIWDRMLSNPLRAVHKFDQSQLRDAVKDGVPRAKRGDIWQLLVEQHKLHNTHYTSSTGNQEPAYEDLLKQLTTHQHAILIDLGRTFPGHPYFTNPLGQGQLALFNLLKAYSLIDPEVGYCQGLSFVAGILLMHMPEDAAFNTMKYMMSELGFRQQYKPDMIALQIQLYQLSRLLHDCHRDLYEHLEKHEIAPTLYAAPWFLTIFASQFPLGFVARVFDLIFLQGIEVVFKVALVLLGNHKELIKHCDSFELIMEFLKTTLPSMGIIQMERIINQVFQMELSKDLYGYEVEYHVLQEEMQKIPRRGDDDIIIQLEQTNHSLKQQNLELLDQLQTLRSQYHSLEIQLQNGQSNQNKLKSHIRTLELERAALLNAVSKLRKLIPVEVLQEADISIPLLDAEKTITNSPIHNPLVNRFMEDLDVKLTSSSLTEFDKEVAALMAARHRKLSDQGQDKNSRQPTQSASNEFLTVQSAYKNERPASTNY